MLILFLLIANVYGTNFIQLTENKAEKLNSSYVHVTCNGVIFNDVYFDREIIFKNLGRPYNLFMHKYSETIYFSNTLRNETHIDFVITLCEINERECIDITDVPGGYAIAYDSDNDDVYFGGHDGLYKFNPVTNKANFFAEKGKSIWGLFVKNKIYYIEYPSQKLFVYKEDSFVKVTAAQNIEIDNFYITKNNDVYYSNKTALFKLEKGSKDVVYLNDELVIRQIVEDSFGDVYFVASDGVYLEDKPYDRVKKLANIDQAFGLTFDGNDKIIYSNKDSINRLNPSQHSDECYSFLIENEEKQNESHENALELAKQLLKTEYLL